MNPFGWILYVKIVRRQVGDLITYFTKNHNRTDANTKKSKQLFSTGWASVKLKDFETGW